MIGNLVPTRLDQRDGKMFALHEYREDSVVT